MRGARSVVSRCVAGLTRLLLVGVTVWAVSRDARAFTPAEALAPMTVTLVRSDAPDCGASCGEWLAMTGQIVPGSAVLLRTALGRLGQRSVPVLIDSPGGNVDAALLMGRMIRERKLDVVVSGTSLTDCRRGDAACAARLRAGQHPGYLAAGIAACASACVLVLAAGTERSVPPNSYVGVHQMVMHQTLQHVINTFRIMRRMVGGRAVEVSRTLIATRPVSSTTVQRSAPETLYSKVDRYLLAMGIGEAIMPLMRSAAPSSIHWMSPEELSATRISTDSLDAATLVARTVPPKPVTRFVDSQSPTATVDAALSFSDGSRKEGTVTWRIVPPTAAEGGGPYLLGEVHVPEANLNGSVSISKGADPASTAGFSIKAHFWVPPGAGLPAISKIKEPKLCDAEFCETPALPGNVLKPTSVDYLFAVSRTEVDLAWALQRRAWLAFPVTLEDGRSAEVGLSITDSGRAVFADWLQHYCGLVQHQASGDRSSESDAQPWDSAPANRGRGSARRERIAMSAL